MTVTYVLPYMVTYGNLNSIPRRPTGTRNKAGGLG